MSRPHLSTTSAHAVTELLVAAGINNLGISPFVHVAKTLGVTPAYVYSWPKLGRIPARYWGRIASMACVELDEIYEMHGGE